MPIVGGDRSNFELPNSTRSHNGDRLLVVGFVEIDDSGGSALVGGNRQIGFVIFTPELTLTCRNQGETSANIFYRTGR